MDAGPGNAPATPDKPRQVPDATRKKVSKILRKSGPGEAPEPPESLREATGAHPSEQNAKKQKTVASKIGYAWLRVRF